MGKKLIANVHIDGTVYGPDGEQDVPKDVAARIDNPNVWDDGGDDGADDDGKQGYSGNKGELEALVAERNADRADADKIVVGGKGTKADLVAALEADDAAASA